MIPYKVTQNALNSSSIKMFDLIARIFCHEELLHNKEKVVEIINEADEIIVDVFRKSELNEMT